MFSVTYEELVVIQYEDETQETEAREQEFEEWDREFGSLQVRCWDLEDSLADAVDELVCQEKLAEAD